MSKKENSTLFMICGALVSLVIFLAIALAFLGIILFLFVCSLDKLIATVGLLNF